MPELPKNKRVKLTPEERVQHRQEATKRYYWRHRERVIASRMRSRKKVHPARTEKWMREGHLRHLYGIGLKDYEALVDSQNNLCAICGLDDKLYVDHNHSEGHVRGLLCQNCNVVIGCAKESIETLLRAAEYIRRGGITRVLAIKNKKTA